MDRDIIVIGGGISGLSLAHECVKKGLRPLVLEKAAKPGGCIHTARIDGFWVELGAHTCYNSYGNLITIIEELGLRDHIIPKKKLPFMMWSDGRLRKILPLLNWIEGACSVARIFRARREASTVRDYFSTIAGEGNYRKVVGQAMNAVICQQAAEFPADLLFKKRPRRKDLPRGFTFDGGLGRIAEALAGEEGIEFRGGSEVVSILDREGIFVIRTLAGEELRAKRIAFATPAPVTARLLEGVSPALSSHLGIIGTSLLESVGTTLPAAAVSHRPIACIIFPSLNSDVPLYSAVSRDVVPDPASRGFAFHFKPGVLSTEGKRTQLATYLGTPVSAMAETQNQVPALRLGHDRWAARLDELLDASAFRGRLLISGNYFQGLALEDCVSRSKTEVNISVM